MNRQDEIDVIIKRFKLEPDKLQMIIESKKGEINYISNHYKEWEKYDLPELEEAIKRINFFRAKIVAMKLLPVFVCIYFIVSEISYIRQAMLSGSYYNDGYIFTIALIKSFIIFFIFPVILIDKLLSYLLDIESLMPFELFYEPLYFGIFILLLLQIIAGF